MKKIPEFSLLIGDKNEWTELKKVLTPTTQYGETKTIVSRSFWLRAKLFEKYRFRDLFNAYVTPAGGAGYKAWEVVEGRQRNHFSKA